MPYIGKSPVGGGFHKLDNLTASATATYALTLGGAAYYPETANQLLVSLNGVIQAPQDSFTVSGSNLVFDSALTASDSIDFVVALGDVLGVGSVSDGAISTAKIANNAVTNAKIDTMAASKLTGALPAIDGSSLTGLGGSIAFLSTITTTYTVNASSFATIDYNTNGTEEFDVGNCFDKSNSKFIAPVAGIYQFNISLRVDSGTANDYINMGLRTPSYSGDGQGTNQSDIVYRSAYVLIGQPSPDFQSLTASTILQCTANQEIEHWVLTETDTSVGINNRGSMFSGCFLG